MSASAKRKRSAKQETEKAQAVPTAAAGKPAGLAPLATVEARRDGRMMRREARGYSIGEVGRVSLGVGDARRWGLHIDDRRRSVLEANVASLTKWAPMSGEKPKPMGELRKIERAFEEDVSKVEKEVVKAGREIEKEAVKAERKIARGEKKLVETVERRGKKTAQKAPSKKAAKKKAKAKKETD